VAVRAQVHDAQYEPLLVPELNLEVVRPDDTLEIVKLTPVDATPGTYSGQFNVYQEGSFRLELAVPETTDERLSRRIQVRLPDLESEHPQRHDAVLNEIAAKTGGQYFVGLAAAVGPPGDSPLVRLLPDKQKVQPVTGGIDREWEEKWLAWMIGAICCLLGLEWLIRRLAKLA
jgi:hypothetical protein